MDFYRMDISYSLEPTHVRKNPKGSLLHFFFLQCTISEYFAAKQLKPIISYNKNLPLFTLSEISFTCLDLNESPNSILGDGIPPVSWSWSWGFGVSRNQWSWALRTPRCLGASVVSVSSTHCPQFIKYSPRPGWQQLHATSAVFAVLLSQFPVLSELIAFYPHLTHLLLEGPAIFSYCRGTWSIARIFVVVKGPNTSRCFNLLKKTRELGQQPEVAGRRSFCAACMDESIDSFLTSISPHNFFLSAFVKLGCSWNQNNLSELRLGMCSNP